MVSAAGLVAGVDLITKALALFCFPGARRGLIVPVENPDFSLGLVGAGLPLTLVVMTVGLALAAVILHRATATWLPVWIAAAILGGALGNLVDRAATGAVHDFLATPGIVLNVADLAVFAGVGGLAAARLTRSAGSRRARRPAAP
jgi:lipoprotein signal peptidase